MLGQVPGGAIQATPRTAALELILPAVSWSVIGTLGPAGRRAWLGGLLDGEVAPLVRHRRGDALEGARAFAPSVG